MLLSLILPSDYLNVAFKFFGMCFIKYVFVKSPQHGLFDYFADVANFMFRIQDIIL